MILDKTYPNFNEAIVIDNQAIMPGESSVIKLNVGRLPSDNRISITAHVIRSINPGPTCLIMGGVHGDEINGIQIVSGLLESGHINQLNSGNLILIPLLNVFGFINFSREVPDGKDVNRSFPGTMQGSLASRVANLVTKKILPHVDFGIDCHTGGSSRYNYPQIRYSPKDPIAVKLAMAFNAPFSIQKTVISKSFRKICKEMGIPVIVFEGGESIRLDGFSIEKAKEGIRRTLQACGIIENNTPPSQQKSILVKRTTWIRAPYSGIFIWSRESGSYVRKNEALGVIKDPYGTKNLHVISKKDGYLIGHNNASVVNQGDALFHLAYDYEKIL
jgi:predicted deacylase